MNSYVMLAIVAAVGLSLLMQLFLSLRPGRGWGLVMPIVFLVLLLVSLTQSINPMFGFLQEKMGIVFNDTAYADYVRIAWIGLAISLAIYIACSLYLNQKRKNLARRRAQRLAAKKAAMARGTAPAFRDAGLDGDFSSIYNSPKGE